MPDNVGLFERVPFWRDASVRGATRCVLAEAVTEKGEHIRLWISQRGSISKRHIEPTVDGEPVFDEITKALVAYFGVSLKVLYNLFGQETLVLVLECLGQIPMEEGLVCQLSRFECGTLDVRRKESWCQLKPENVIGRAHDSGIK
jgi:hypothetical protein